MPKVNDRNDISIDNPMAVGYWQNVAEKERKRADDNLRLAAERATMIQELKDELREAYREAERRGEALKDAKEEIQHLRATQALKVCPTCQELTEQQKVCEVWHCMKCYQAADHNVTKSGEK